MIIHKPVLLKEMLSALMPRSGGIYIDATYGGGGYSQAILDFNPEKIIAFDQDPTVIEPDDGRITLIRDKFSAIARYIDEPIDGIVYDFGLSTMQIKNKERGFSFYEDGPLDMRMSQKGVTAADVINKYSAKDLEKIIDAYGEDPRSHKMAKLIVENRPFYRTKELADLIKGRFKSIRSLHPATLLFQAIRIYVNDELKEIENSLASVLPLLKPSGRIVTVSFHSLEDRIVKFFFKNNHIMSNPTVTPSRQEIRENPCARSARLRFGIKD